MDHYSIVTHLANEPYVTFYGSSSPSRMSDPVGTIFTESAIRWTTPSDDSWGSNHTSSSRQKGYTKLKYAPTGYSRASSDGSVK